MRNMILDLYPAFYHMLSSNISSIATEIALANDTTKGCYIQKVVDMVQKLCQLRKGRVVVP